MYGPYIAHGERFSHLNLATPIPCCMYYSRLVHTSTVPFPLLAVSSSTRTTYIVDVIVRVLLLLYQPHIFTPNAGRNDLCECISGTEGVCSLCLLWVRACVCVCYCSNKRKWAGPFNQCFLSCFPFIFLA